MKERNESVDRIIACWDSAPEVVRENGRLWYPRVSDIAANIHPSKIAGAGVIAALSPRISWQSNLKGAISICRAALSGSEIVPDVAGVYRNKEKAWKIARGEYKWSPEEHLNACPGYYKVNNFFKNIIGCVDCVTVDVWAARVALPDYTGASIKGNTYLEVEKAYQDAARAICGINARDLQAVCWINVRGSGK